MLDPAIKKYCEYQERCHSEVRSKLITLKIYGDDLENQIVFLVETGLLNEERYARAFARGRWRLKRWGRNKIRQHLKLKKVSEYCIKKGLSEIDSDEYEKVLFSIFSKKLQEQASEKNIFVKKGKIQRFLMQRGFEQDMIQDCLKTMDE